MLRFFSSIADVLLFSTYDIIWITSYFVNKDFTVIAAQAPWGKQRRRRCTNATPIFFPEKENGRRPSKRKAFPIASEQLEELQCLPIALPCARRCRGWRCYTIWLAPIIRCRSAHLVEVQPNFRLLPVPTMRRAQQCCIWHAVCRQANVTRASR